MNKCEQYGYSMSCRSQLTFMTRISGACLESFFEGGGEHFNISAEKIKCLMLNGIHIQRYFAIMCLELTKNTLSPFLCLQ